MKKFDELISPLIKQGLSIEAIHSSLKEEFPVSTRTVRHWVNISKFQIGLLLDNFTSDEVINKIRDIEYRVGAS